MKEQDIQAKILKKLKAMNYVAINVITSSTSGTSDIIACSPTGRFYAIEVKKPREVPSELQWAFIREVQENGGIAFYCDSYADFLFKHDKCSVSGTNCFKAPAFKKTLIDL